MKIEAGQRGMGQRFLLIALFGLLLSAIAWIVDFPVAALGVLAGVPVSLLNHWLMRHGMQQAQLTQRAREEAGEEVSAGAAQFEVLKWSLLRLVVSIVALLAANKVGPEFMVGALAGLLAEMFTYVGDAFQMFAGLKRTS